MLQEHNDWEWREFGLILLRKKIRIYLHFDGMDTTRCPPPTTGNSGASVWMDKGLMIDGEL